MKKAKTSSGIWKCFYYWELKHNQNCNLEDELLKILIKQYQTYNEQPYVADEKD